MIKLFFECLAILAFMIGMAIVAILFHHLV